MAWYNVKPREGDVVISSRVRLARNVSGYPFGKRLSAEGANEIISRVGEALGDAFVRTDMTSLSREKAASLVEQHLISRDFAAAKGPHALFSNDNKSVYVMACEEDHIRVQCILPGLAIEDAFRFAEECDNALDAALPIAFDEQLGYLTHCPTNLGTGMRASVMLFLPALTEAGQIPALAQKLSKLGLTMRGIYGEGSQSAGYLYQVSNQITLGPTEEELIAKLSEALRSIIEKERALRGNISEEAAERRADRIHRAEGIARYATLLSSEEFFRLFADLKLGIATGVITTLSHEALQTMLIHSQPATLSLGEDIQANGAFARDRARASFIRKALEVSNA